MADEDALMADNVTLTPNPGTAKLAGWILDKHVGPQLRSLSKATQPPALKPQTDTFGSWILNQVFHGEFKDDKLRILLSVFMSRIWSARESYEIGREHLASYITLLDQTNTHVNRYRAAVREFEAAIHHAHLGVTAVERWRRYSRCLRHTRQATAAIMIGFAS